MSRYPTWVTRCTIQKPNGTFCDRPMSDAAPFPICAKHSAELFLALRKVVAQADPDEYTTTTKVRRPATGSIYYVAFESLIKIGWTADIQMRMRSYPVGELLAMHPGTREDERALLKKFRADLARGREWFHRSPALELHIDDVVQAYGIPKYSGRKAPVRVALHKDRASSRRAG